MVLHDKFTGRLIIARTELMPLLTSAAQKGLKQVAKPLSEQNVLTVRLAFKEVFKKANIMHFYALSAALLRANNLSAKGEHFKAHARNIDCELRRMVDVVSVKCKEVGCCTHPSFNYPGEQPLFFAKYRLRRMVDVVSAKCNAPGCILNVTNLTKCGPCLVDDIPNAV